MTASASAGERSLRAPRLQMFWYAIRRTVKEFSRDHCTDLAAALTYYGVLSMFPALIALISMIGVFGNGKGTIDGLMDVVAELAPGAGLDTVRTALENISASPGTGIGFVVGLAGALWSASGYVGAFGRAMNRIFEVEEGRPIWKLRPAMLVVTAAVLVLAAVAAASLVLSGPVARAVGNAVGIGDTAVTVWNIAKWPVLLLLVILIVSLLYFATPNVRRSKFLIISPGAALSIVAWLLVSAGFAFYVGSFGSYNKTYGSLAGVIVFLLWLWITNVALLFGAEFDAELERVRQLREGVEAEAGLQLPLRDRRNVTKAEKAEGKLVAAGARLRRQLGGASSRNEGAGTETEAPTQEQPTQDGESA